MNSTVHPDDLLVVPGWLADLEETSMLYYQTVTYDCKPPCSYQVFIPFLTPLRGFKHAGRDTHNMTSSATLARLSVTLAAVLRTTLSPQVPHQKPDREAGDWVLSLARLFSGCVALHKLLHLSGFWFPPL